MSTRAVGVVAVLLAHGIWQRERHQLVELVSGVGAPAAVHQAAVGIVGVGLSADTAGSMWVSAGKDAAVAYPQAVLGSQVAELVVAVALVEQLADVVARTHADAAVADLPPRIERLLLGRAARVERDRAEVVAVEIGHGPGTHALGSCPPIEGVGGGGVRHAITTRSTYKLR